MSAAAVKHKGRPLLLGGDTFIVPPLSLGAVEDFEERLEQLSAMPRPQQLRTIVDLAHRALQRNYPEISRDDVRELIDVANAEAVYLTIMGASVPEADPAATPGEARQMGGTGQPSMPT